MTIPKPDAMNTLPFLTNIADAVGVPATNWDAPGIVFLKLLAIVFLVLLNGFFVASEFAIVKVRASQLDALAAPSNGRAQLARHVTSHLDAYLSATQLGITLASLGLGWLGEAVPGRYDRTFFRPRQHLFACADRERFLCASLWHHHDA